MPRLRLLAVAAGISIAVLSVASSASPSGTPTAAAQAARTVTVDSGPLVPGEMATVRWTGFTPGPAYIYICARRYPAGTLPGPDACYGDTLVTGETKADGTGSAKFTVRSALFPYGVPKNDGSTSEYQPGGLQSADCRGVGCSVVVTECSAVVSADKSTFDWYDVVPGIPGEYDDDPVVEVVWIFEDFGDGQGPQPVPTLRRRPVEEPEAPPAPDPIRATGPILTGYVSDVGGLVHPPWRRAIAEQHDINLGMTAVANYSVAIDGVISGAADLAVSGAPANATQQATLVKDGQSLVYVPISVSTVAVGHNVYPMLPMRDVRISAQSLSGLLWPEGQPVSSITKGSLAADQGECAPTVSRETVLYTKGGASEATLTASAFLDAASKKGGAGAPPWEAGVVDVVPSQSSTMQPRNTHPEVARDLASLKSSDQTAFSFAARFGLMDTTYAQEYRVETASLQNAAGRWVKPSAAGALATLKTSTVGADNIVDINELSPDPAAYPLVVVTYAVAPTTLTKDFTSADAAAIRTALSLIVSGDGQRIAEEEGFVPLTGELERRAEATIAKIGSIVPAPATTTTTTTTVTPTTVARPRTPGFTPRSPTPPSRNSPRPRSNPQPNSPSAPPTTRDRPTTTTRDGPPTTTAVTRPAPTTAVTRPAPTTVTPVTPATSAGAAVPDTVATAGSETASPVDNFADLFSAGPFSPAMPTLAAGGGSIAVVGQGINLWRARHLRRRPGP